MDAEDQDGVLDCKRTNFALESESTLYGTPLPGSVGTTTYTGSCLSLQLESGVEMDSISECDQ
eukprot:scaffold1355_cov106-Skeletonema_dohrnii-CCMP3373.AAC.4